LIYRTLEVTQRPESGVIGWQSVAHRG